MGVRVSCSLRYLGPGRKVEGTRKFWEAVLSASWMCLATVVHPPPEGWLIMEGAGARCVC